MPELKPCPFCGGEPTIYDIEPHKHAFCGMPDHTGSTVIECGCGCGLIDEKHDAVIERWNRRPETAEWQPIETAPMDGTAVLVMRDIWPGTKSGRAEKCSAHNTYVAAWWGMERNGKGAWGCYMDAIRDPECPVEPTHWMPLPPAPGKKGGE